MKEENFIKSRMLPYKIKVNRIGMRKKSDKEKVDRNRERRVVTQLLTY